MKITPGKQKGLKAVSDSRGVIAAAAMDQRGSLRSAIAKDKGIDKKDVTAQMMEEFKTAVVRVLTPHASAILLDPEARAGDILLLAGKGHENYQILADRTLEFDDREVARRALRERGYDRPEGGPGFGT